MINRHGYAVLALAPIILLSGCKPLDWIKESFGGTKNAVAAPAKQVDFAAASVGGNGFSEGVLAVWADGPLVTQKDIDEKLALLMKQRPELKKMSAQLLPMLKPQLLNAIISSKIIGKWIKQEGIDKTEEYKTMLQQVIENIKDSVNVEFFAKKHTATVSEADKKDYYNKN